MMCYLRHETKHKKAKDSDTKRSDVVQKKEGDLHIFMLPFAAQGNGISLNLEHFCDESNRVLVERH